MGIRRVRYIWVVVVVWAWLANLTASAREGTVPIVTGGSVEREAAVIEALRIGELKTQATPTIPQGSQPGIRLRLNGHAVSFTEPIRLQGDAVLVPLREIAAQLHVGVLDLGDEAFQLMFADGTQQVVELRVLDGIPLVTDAQLATLFAVEVSFDPVHQVIALHTRDPRPFQTYLVEKPPELLQQEQTALEIAKRAAKAVELPAYVPASARPSVDLQADLSYTYVARRNNSPLRSLFTTVQGRALA